MKVDKNLKQELLDKLTNFQESLPVYSIRNLSYDEMKKNAKYISSKFIGEDTEEYFESSMKREGGSTLINLPQDTKMRVFQNSNNIIIKRKMQSLDNLIEEKLDKQQLAEITIKAMKRLELDRWKLSIEQVDFERLWQIKATAITIDKKIAPEILCRIIGSFRRHINNNPVYGRASIFVKIAGDNLIESIGIDWRQIEERPIDKVEIINPDSAVEIIIKNLNSYSPETGVTSQDYKPEFFSLGYFSMPRRQQQNYMQPVFVAMFKSIKWTSLNRLVVIPASTDIYEPICRTQAAFVPSELVKK